MKTYIFTISFLLLFIFSCKTSNGVILNDNNDSKINSDTIRIANDALEYEIIIIDGGFTSWFNTFARPRGFYSQSYLEVRNRFWVIEYNNRANNPTVYSNIYEWPINYTSNVDYGYDVNYMLYNYLVYFQLQHKQNLGGYSPRN
jgi:hypothetical protein